MTKTVRIVPEVERGGQSISFVLAMGAVRQMCRLKTTFQTQQQALSYLHKHRTEFERAARERLSRGEVEDGIVHLKML